MDGILIRTRVCVAIEDKEVDGMCKFREIVNEANGGTFGLFGISFT